MTSYNRFQMLLHPHHARLDKNIEAAEIRKHFKPALFRDGTQRIRIKKNLFEINNADNARMWHPVANRVCSIASRSGFVRHLGCLRSSHRKPSTGNRLTQHCEVLGPHYCTECLKLAQRNKYQQQITGTFPEISINERTLRNHAEYVTTDKLGYGQRLSQSLPAIPVTSKSEFDAASYDVTNPYDLMITASELQRRVMDRNRKLRPIKSVDKSPRTSSFVNSVEYPRERTIDTKKRARFVTLPQLEYRELSRISNK